MSEKMKKAVMYGAGNIGRGFIGQLFSESGYEVAFIDINKEIISALNKEGRYPIRILNGRETRDIWVENVTGIDGSDLDRVIDVISEADIMATAVGAGALPGIAKPVAKGLKERWRKQRPDALDILLCENLPDTGSFFADLIKNELGLEYGEMFNDKVGMVEASIGRMVPLMNPEMQEGNLLRVCVEEFCQLPVDQNGFRGKIPLIKNMIPYNPFAYILQRKLYIHNMGHALTAYLGNLKGYSYIADAIDDPTIRPIVKATMKALAECLSSIHGSSLDEAVAYANDLILRFGNRQLGDTVGRVGNDVRRKLSPRDRLVGAARICVENGVHPVYICLGIAAAIRFGSQDSNEKNSVLNMTAEEVLERVCEIKTGDPLYNMIIRFCRVIESGASFEEATSLAADML